jgi:hypothetical protein
MYKFARASSGDACKMLAKSLRPCSKDSAGTSATPRKAREATV